MCNLYINVNSTNNKYMGVCILFMSAYIYIHPHNKYI